MKNIGLTYTKSQLNNLLTPKKDPNNLSALLIGVIFAAGTDFPDEFEIRKVYFDPGDALTPVSFYSLLSTETKEKLYREDVNGVKLEAATTAFNSAGDEIEFTDSLNFGFGFFSCEELEILKMLSNRIIISGATMDPGMVSFPDNSITFPNPPFATLVAEVDRNDMTNVPINVSLPTVSPISRGPQPRAEDLPTLSIAMPCPPYWDPAEKLMKMISTLRYTRSKVVKRERWPKLLWLHEIKKAWLNFSQELDEDLRRRRKYETDKQEQTEKKKRKPKGKTKKLEILDE